MLSPRVAKDDLSGKGHSEVWGTKYSLNLLSGEYTIEGATLRE